MTLRPVTRQDLPYFEVVTIEREAVDSPGEPSAPGPWKLTGQISDARVVSPGHWSVLERIGGDCVTAYWDPVEGAGDKVSFLTPDLPEDIYVGCRLTYLSWNGKLHAKLVEDGPSAWTAKMFQPGDAVEAPFVDDEGMQWKPRFFWSLLRRWRGGWGARLLLPPTRKEDRAVHEGYSIANQTQGHTDPSLRSG